MKNNKDNNRKQTRLLNKTTVALLAAGAAGAVYVLSPSLTALEKKISDTNSPEVSLTYLQELERINPDDPMIPYLKAKLLYEKGNYNEVMDLLDPEIKEDPDHSALDTFILYLKTRIAMSDSIDNKSKEQVITEVKAELDALVNRNFSPEQIHEIVNICYQIFDANRAYDYIIKIEDPDYKTLNEIYSLALQSGHYDKALEIRKSLFLHNETEEGYKELFKLYVEAFDKNLFASFLKEYDGKFKDDINFIKAEIDTANKLGLFDESAVLLETLCQKEPTYENLMKLVETSVSKQDLDKAKDVLEKLYASDEHQDHKPEIARKLHDVYTWQSDIENSQRLSLELLNFDPTKEELEQGIAESSALADMEKMGIFYDASFEKGLVAEDDYDDFVDVMEKAYGSEKALSAVDSLLEKSPKNEVLLGHKLRLTSYVQDYPQVVKAYESLRTVRVPTSQEALYAANAYVMLGEDKKALTALTSVKNWNEENDDYMIMVSSLAWSCDDDSIGRYSQNILLDRNSSDANTYQLLNSIGPIDENNLDKLIAYYEKKKDFAIASELLTYSNEKGNYELMQKLLKVVEKNDPASFRSNAVLSYRAVLSMHERDYEQAKGIYEKMLKNDSSNIEAIEGLCNLALLNGDKKEAESLYKKYRSKFITNPNAWQIAASLASELGYGNEAKAWYEQYLSTVSEPSAVDLLSYASVLEDLGYTDKAYKLRRFVVETKTKDLLSLDDNNVTLASIISTFVSKDKGEAVLRKELESTQSQALVSQFISTLIDRNDIKSAIYFRKRSSLAQYALSDSQELLLAVRTKDKAKIKDLLERGVGIKEPERYDALEKLTKRLEAYQLAKRTVEVSPDKSVNNSLRSQMAADNNSMSRSLMAVYNSQPKWGVHSYTVSYHAPYSLGQLSLATVYQRSKAPDDMAIDKLKSEKRVIGSVSYETEKHDFTLTADLADGAADPRYGVKLDYLFRLDERYSVSLTGALNQHSTLSHMMTVLGKDNYAQMSIGANPWGREYFVFTSRYHKYKSRYDENLGSGYDLEAMAMTPVFSSDPTVYGYVAGLYQNNHISDDPLNKTNKLNGSLDNENINSIGPDSYISEQYKHLALGIATNHGEPGVPGPSVPSPRFIFDAFTGYNFTEKKMDAGISAGVGVSLFKAQDELFLMSSLQTADRQGNKSVVITVGYSMVF